jgi:aspartate 1-decarboxylase
VRRRMLNAKIHRAAVTDADLHYVGSITIDRRLLDAAGIVEHEQVSVLDIDNGQRFETYTIVGGAGEICVNGAAARLVQPGDRVIILSYVDVEDSELAAHRPTVVHVTEKNEIVSLGHQAGPGVAH